MFRLGIQKYEAFLKIVELGNITRAADALGYSQSALSNLVAGLESEWGLRLLLREKYGVRPTQECERLLPYLHHIVEEHRSMEAEIKKLQRLEKGIIRLGSFQSGYSHLLPKILKPFTTRYPQIQFEFKLANYREIAQMIHDGRVDCGFVSVPTPFAMKTIPIHRDRVVAVFPPGTENVPDPFPVADLRKENVIALSEFDTEVVTLFQRYGIHLEKKYYADNEYTVLPMIASGVGMCILPELILRDTPHDFVVRALDPPAYRTLALAYRESGLTPALQKFIRHVTDEYRLE